MHGARALRQVCKPTSKPPWLSADLHARCVCTSRHAESLHVECVHCNDTMESRNCYMEEHILQKCKKISQEDRKGAEANVKTKIKPIAGERPATSLSFTSLKKEQDVGQFLHGKLNKQQQTVINRKLLSSQSLMAYASGLSTYPPSWTLSMPECQLHSSR